MAKSMKLDQSKGIGGLLKQGHTTQEGVDEAVSKNIEAAKQLGRIVHSSMGPNGMVRRRAVDPRGARASPRRRRALVRASLSRARARGARGARLCATRRRRRAALHRGAGHGRKRAV